MLGLQKGIVQVVTHRRDWSNLFEQERNALQQHMGSFVLDIQHVGSTSVPDLPAKPILDIAVAVASEEMIRQCVPLLCQLGYIDRGDQGADGGYLMVRESSPEIRTHHLHMVMIDDPQWHQYLKFRNALRADDLLRERYAALKKTLQEQFPKDRRAYTAAKTDFIRNVLQEPI